jgi:hypothetical protein
MSPAGQGAAPGVIEVPNAGPCEPRARRARQGNRTQRQCSFPEVDPADMTARREQGLAPALVLLPQATRTPLLMMLQNRAAGHGLGKGAPRTYAVSGLRAPRRTEGACVQACHRPKARRPGCMRAGVFLAGPRGSGSVQGRVSPGSGAGLVRLWGARASQEAVAQPMSHAESWPRQLPKQAGMQAGRQLRRLTCRWAGNRHAGPQPGPAGGAGPAGGRQSAC